MNVLTCLVGPACVYMCLESECLESKDGVCQPDWSMSSQHTTERHGSVVQMENPSPNFTSGLFVVGTKN